tara:strand:+ start:2320 stop:2439 length:120 start_codon:yes stop_codon:yes gene_type:complete
MARYDLSSGLQLISLQTALRETVDWFESTLSLELMLDYS